MQADAQFDVGSERTQVGAAAEVSDQRAGARLVISRTQEEVGEMIHDGAGSRTGSDTSALLLLAAQLRK